MMAEVSLTARKLGSVTAIEVPQDGSEASQRCKFTVV